MTLPYILDEQHGPQRRREPYKDYNSALARFEELQSLIGDRYRRITVTSLNYVTVDDIQDFTILRLAGWGFDPYPANNRTLFGLELFNRSFSHCIFVNTLEIPMVDLKRTVLNTKKLVIGKLVVNCGVDYQSCSFDKCVEAQYPSL